MYYYDLILPAIDIFPYISDWVLNFPTYNIGFSANIEGIANFFGAILDPFVTIIDVITGFLSKTFTVNFGFSKFTISLMKVLEGISGFLAKIFGFLFELMDLFL